MARRGQGADRHDDPASTTTRSGGFFYTSNDHEKLFARAKDQYDGAQPSGNSVAARNLVRLWARPATSATAPGGEDVQAFAGRR